MVDSLRPLSSGEVDLHARRERQKPRHVINVVEFADGVKDAARTALLEERFSEADFGLRYDISDEGERKLIRLEIRLKKLENPDEYW